MSDLNTTSESKDSIFNAGISKLERIDKIKRGITNAKITNDFGAIKELLTSFYTEMYERLDDEEIKACQVHEHNIQFVDNLIMQRSKMSNDCLNVFNNFERYLSRLEYKYKMSLPNKAKDSDSVI